MILGMFFYNMTELDYALNRIFPKEVAVNENEGVFKMVVFPC